MSQSLLFDASPEPKIDLPGYPCIISPCGQYRYTCYRIWNVVEKPRLVLWCCLNPSKADATEPDNSLTRMVNFAKSWGYDGICIVNLFAYRSTDRTALEIATDPIGDDADYWIVQVAEKCETIVCGWGEWGAFKNRGKSVMVLLNNLGRDMYCLAITKDGHPIHPLYQPSHLQPVLFRLPATGSLVTTSVEEGK